LEINVWWGLVPGYPRDGLVDVMADKARAAARATRSGRDFAGDRAYRACEAEALAVAELYRMSRRVRDLADPAERSKPKGKRKRWGLILLDIDVDTCWGVRAHSPPHLLSGSCASTGPAHRSAPSRACSTLRSLIG
jgi:hypothetical protein